MIHVCYATSNLYAKFAGASILSMLENHNPPPPSITIHILHDNTLTLDNRDKFSNMIGRYGQLVNFYNVEQLCADRIDTLNNLFSKTVNFKRFTTMSLCRLLVPEIFKDHAKLILMDADMIINLDVSKLWRIDVDNFPFAAVSESDNGIPCKTFLTLCRDDIVKPEDYFNMGVLVMNLNTLRQDAASINNAIKFIAENSEYSIFLDQDILNYCYSDKYLKIPVDFNRSVLNARTTEAAENIMPKIYHYYGKALEMNMNDKFNRLWFSYFVKTPFFNEDTITRLYEGTRQVYIERQNFATQVSAMVSGKTRGFFVSKQNVDAVKNIFYVQPHEEFIIEDSPESFQRVITLLRESQGKQIFFLLINEYPKVYQILSQLGFIAGRDFINAVMFLSDAHGVPLTPPKLVNLL